MRSITMESVCDLLGERLYEALLDIRMTASQNRKVL